MSESFIQVAPDSSGKLMRAILRTVGLNSVYDEVIELSDQSGVLITPVAERDLLSDLTLGSGLSGLPIIGYDSAIGTRSAFPLYNGAYPVTGPAGGNISVSGNSGGVITGSAGPAGLNALNAAVTLILSTTLQSVLAFLNITVNVLGTLVFEASVDNTNFFSVPAKNIATGKWQSSLVNPTTASTGLYAFEGIGAIEYRVRVSAYTSGTTAGSLTGMAYPDILTPSMAGIGQAVPSEAIYLGGNDGTNLRGITVKNVNPLTTDYGAHIRTLFQQLPNATLPSHTLWMGASDATNLQGLLVESATNPNLFTAIRQGTNQLGINASNQAAIQNPPNLDTALSTRLADAKFPSTATLADATANPTLTAVQDYQMLFNGSTWDRMKSSGVTGMAGIGGDTASAVSDAGNPVKIGGVANTGLPTAVTTGQRVNLLTDVYGRPRVVDERAKLLGMYYAESGNITVLATAHTSLQGFMWLVNTSSTVIVYVRSVGFVWSGTAATAFPTSPRITIERVTFTGTPSGAAITPAKRDSTDATNTATLNTASTGLTLTAGAVIESFVVGSILTAVGAVSVPEEIWNPKDDDGLIVLRQNQGIVIRQPDAGTAADTRKIVMTLAWEER